MTPTSPNATVVGRTLYVATDGRDTNDGSPASPWRTIQRGLRGARAGDTVVVEAGAYARAAFVRGGTAGAPITLRAQGRVTLTGHGTGVGLAINRVDHVVVDGFEVSRFEVGIGVAYASHVLVRGNTLRSNSSAGIQNWKVVDVRVIGNRLLDPGPKGGPAVQDYGVNFYFARHVVAQDNRFFGNHNQSLSFKRKVRAAKAVGNVFEGCLHTCLYVGQNDDDASGDMTSSWIAVRHNTFDVVTAAGKLRYRVAQPIAVRNVREASVEYNVIDPACDGLVSVVPSPQRWGLAAGANTIRYNVVRRV